jgi:hypothetical protein
LLEKGEVHAPCSILIVVGRQDTGEVEAQIRGSRHAWDVRLISVDSLVKLVRLKEDADDPETARKIRSVLVPMEYTRLDALIDVMFATAKDVESAAGAELAADDQLSDDERIDSISGSKPERKAWEFTDSGVLQAKRETIVSALAKRESTILIRRSRALYWSANHEVRAACTVSKRYTSRSATPYWYAYHPRWDEFLGDGERSFLVLGCMDQNIAFAIPLSLIRSVLDSLNTSERDDGGHYWHLHLTERSPGQIALQLPKRRTTLPLDECAISF